MASSTGDLSLGGGGSFTMNTRSVQRTMITSGYNPVFGVGNGSTQEPGMRLGSNYQAQVPGYLPGLSSEGPGSILLWRPTNALSDLEVDRYLKLAKDQHGYSTDQALGMLFFHKYDVNKATSDLTNFCPLQGDWSMEDKVVFEQAFRYHGKHFQRIRSMLPDKPISSLVKYYYLWKRSFSQYSLMDKHSRRNGKRISAGLPASNDDSDSTQSGSIHSFTDAPLIPTMQLVGKGKQLPKGIRLSIGELSSMGADKEGTLLKEMSQDIVELKETVQSRKQELSQLREQLLDEEIEQLRPANYAQKCGVPARWSEEEIQIALEAVRQHGKNPDALARSLANKSVAQCRNFFTNYKRKLNLPRLIAAYELKHGRKTSRYSRQAREQLEEEEDVQDGEPMMVHPTLLTAGSNVSSESGDSLSTRPRISILQYRGSYI